MIVSDTPYSVYLQGIRDAKDKAERRKQIICGFQALRTYSGAWAPLFDDTLEHLVNQLREASDELLVAIVSAPEEICRRKGIQYGDLPVKVVKRQAQYRLENRTEARAWSRRRGLVILTAVCTVLCPVILYALGINVPVGG